MGFYDSDTWNPISGAEPGFSDGKESPKVSYAELLDALHENGLVAEDNSDLILSLFLVDRTDRYDIRNEKIALMRKGQEMFEAGFGTFSYNPAKTGVIKLDFKEGKAIGKTFNGGRFTKNRKYWDWECPLKFLYFHMYVPQKVRCNPVGFFMNFTGTEVVIVDEDWKVLKRFRTKQSEAIEFLKACYESNPYSKDGFADVMKKLQNRFKFIRG